MSQATSNAQGGAVQRNAEEMRVPFAIVVLTSLAVKRFVIQDDWQAAMDRLRSANTPFLPLKYHPGADCYFRPEERT